MGTASLLAGLCLPMGKGSACLVLLALSLLISLLCGPLQGQRIAEKRGGTAVALNTLLKSVSGLCSLKPGERDTELTVSRQLDGGGSRL